MATGTKTNGSAFPEFDLTKIWADFKMPEFGDFKLPEFDVDAFVAAQQKNVEAINLANKAAVEGWQALAKKQAELWQAAFEKTGAMAQDVVSAAEPKDKLAMQAAFAKTAFEDSIANARETQTMATKAANKTVDIVSRRWAESLDEMVNFVEKTAEKVAPKAPAAK